MNDIPERGKSLSKKFRQLATFLGESDFLLDIDHQFAKKEPFTPEQAEEMAQLLMNLYKFTHYHTSDCPHKEDWGEL